MHISYSFLKIINCFIYKFYTIYKKNVRMYIICINFENLSEKELPTASIRSVPDNWEIYR